MKILIKKQSEHDSVPMKMQVTVVIRKLAQVNLQKLVIIKRSPEKKKLNQMMIESN